MKRFLREFVPGLLLMCLLSSPAWAQTKIGTINLARTFDNYWKRKDAETALRDREADVLKELQSMMADFDKAKEEYQKLLTGANDQAVSSDEREKRKKAAEDKLKQLKEMQDNIQKIDRQAATEKDERRKRVRDNLLADILKVIEAKAKDRNLTMVLDTEATTVNGTKVVLYNNNENDLTEEVLHQLNLNAPPETSQTDDKKEDKKEEKKDDKKKSSKK